MQAFCTWYNLNRVAGFGQETMPLWVSGWSAWVLKCELSTAIDAQGSASKGTDRGWLARRAVTAMPSSNTSEESVAGVSSFAYQGTNSHVILAGMSRQAARVEQPDRQWQHRRFWFQASLNSVMACSTQDFDLS